MLSHSSSSSDVTAGGGGSIETDQSQAHIRQLLEAMLLQANVEDMSYEELLDRFGPGIEGPAAAPAAAVRAVPRRRLTGEDVEALNGKEARSTERACCVCLEDYGKGDTVKTLPRCSHRFHAHCIDRWLLCRNACPVCRVGLEVPATEGPPGTGGGGGVTTRETFERERRSDERRSRDGTRRVYQRRRINVCNPISPTL